jgi:hypothetical protein
MSLHDHRQMREVFKRAYESGSQEEIRKAYFGVIPFLLGDSTQIQELGPLAPLPADSFFAGEDAPFDMANDTRVCRTLNPDGTTAIVFIAAVAEFDNESTGVEENPVAQCFLGCRNQFDVWQRENSLQLDGSPLVPVIFIHREHILFTQYVLKVQNIGYHCHVLVGGRL